MLERGTYGASIARLFQLTEAPFLAAKGAGTTAIAVTRLRSDRPLAEPTSPPPREAAYSIHLHLRDSADHELWLRGKRVFGGAYRQGCTSLLTLDDEPSARIGNPFDFLQVYLPYGSLDDVAADHGAPPIRELVWPRGAEDAAAAGIAKLLVQAMEGERSNALFVEHILLALRIHVAQLYGGMSAQSRSPGGLAPWQERRAKDLLRAHFAGPVSIADLARECGLSPSHFTRAFRQTLGMQPYRWLSGLRIEEAKRLLRQNELPLSEIALACGFGDQAHFTRVFSRDVGVAPGAWQRSQRG
ncbi:MAG TPA: AraC family transcriptional regulator [Acidisoma sp.]|uniref:AraC family transcriptional regulator n=1 Tax=Acidisoma sp. TaxID=1872115 RepID=UPI002B6FB320|nr:AraC family transcriptional regulator [Acidisoma sp.]HTI00299.1 AraC family transcriptional regulator [Acidisoma sp.]